MPFRPLRFDVPFLTGIVLEIGSLKTELESCSATATLFEVTSYHHKEKEAFFEKLAHHPSYAIRECAAYGIGNPTVLAELLCDRSFNVRRAAFKMIRENQCERAAIKALEKALRQGALDMAAASSARAKLLALLAANVPLPKDRLELEDLSEVFSCAKKLPKTDAEEAAKNKAVEDNKDFSPVLHQQVGRLIYEGIECPLYGDDIWNNAWDWTPVQETLARGRLMDAIAETPVWADPEIRRAAAGRKDISPTMAAKLLDDPNPEVRQTLIENEDDWDRLPFKAALALAKKDPSHALKLLRFRRSKKDLRRLAKALAENPDPHVAWAAQEKLLALKKRRRHRGKSRI